MLFLSPLPNKGTFETPQLQLADWTRGRENEKDTTSEFDKQRKELEKVETLFDEQQREVKREIKGKERINSRNETKNNEQHVYTFRWASFMAFVFGVKVIFVAKTASIVESFAASSL